MMLYAPGNVTPQKILQKLKKKRKLEFNMFKMKRSSYNEALANEAINGQNIYIVGRELTAQRKYVDNSPTDEITGYQVWCATDTNNPFKVKFSAEDKPSLEEFQIGDIVNFEKLEAIDVNGNIYFRAKKIKKAK